MDHALGDELDFERCAPSLCNILARMKPTMNRNIDGRTPAFDPDCAALPALARGVVSSCNPRTAQRAIAIARAQTPVRTRRCRRAGDNTILTAFVESSDTWGSSYRVSATVDEASGTLVDHACTCPASYQFDGPCKHCAALALVFANDPMGFEGYAESRLDATSPAWADYLRRAQRALSLAEPGSVALTPTLSHAYGQWSARFEIAGPRGSYILRDFAEFLRCRSEGAVHSYGKNLAFAHVDEAFTPLGLSIAQFISRVDDARRESSKAVWYTSQPGIKGRDLALAEGELAELIAILDRAGKTHVAVEGNDTTGRRKTQAPICHDIPALPLTIARVAGGFEIECPRRGQVFSSAGDMLVWLDDAFYRGDPSTLPRAEILRTVLESTENALFVSNADMPLFCATALPELEGCTDFELELDPVIEKLRPVPCSLEFYFDKSGRYVTCDAYAVYGERRLRIVGTEDPGIPKPTEDRADEFLADTSALIPLRDERTEQRGRALVASYFSIDAKRARSKTWFEARLPLKGDDALANLLFGGLARFREEGAVFTTAAFDRLISDKRPRVSTGVAIAGDLIALDVSSSDLGPDELAMVLQSYRKKRRYHRLKSGAFLDLAQMELAELDRIAADLDVSPAQLSQGRIELPAYRAFYLDEALKDARREDSFRRYIENFAQETRHRRALPASLRATLRPYQAEGFQWLSTLADMGFGGILADEMGLGKTVQLIAFLLDRRGGTAERRPSLVICPASLVYNWQAEFARFAPDMAVAVVAGTKRERTALRGRQGTEVYVTSYDLARIDADEWSRIPLDCCILDEAQYIKNHGTLTARAVKRFDARLRFALTGTPIENRLSEIWSIFDFIMPGFLGSYMRFKERFELDIIGGDRDVAQRLTALIGPFMLRRLKREVTQDLPDKLEAVMPVRLTGKQRRIYDATEQKLREDLARQRKERKSRNASADGAQQSSVEVLAELMRLRQICCDPRLAFEDFVGEGAKLDAICDLVESAANDGQKTLVFSQFTSFLDLIGQKLDERGILYYVITGSTPKRRRISLAETFNDDETPAFLISLKAGGTGLNLTGASVVVHADPWWNAAAQNQATDRAHRIGQENIVNVYSVVAEDTVEERIMHLQQKKSDLADTIVGAESPTLAGLTKEQLIELLEG